MRLAGGAAVALQAAPAAPAEPSSCVIVFRNDPDDHSRSERYETLRALAREMELRDEALVIEQRFARRSHR